MTSNIKNYNPEILQETTQLQRRAADPVNSVFVSASAGSGKTKVLTDRVLRLLLSGVRSSKILCLTFTKVAAAEMQNRIYAELSKWAVIDEKELQERLYHLTGNDFNNIAKTRTLFATILDDENGLKINTIHSFCQNLMKKFPIEAGVNPNFKIIDKQTENELLNEARLKLLNRALSDDNLAQKITYITAKLNENSFSEIIMEVIRKRERLAALKAEYFDIDGVVEKLYRVLGCGEKHPAPSGHPSGRGEFLFAPRRGGSEADGVVGSLVMAELASELNKYQDPKGKIIADFIKNPILEKFQQYKNIFLTVEGEPRKRVVDAKTLKSAPHLEEIILAEQQRIIEFVNYLNASEIAISTANLLFVADKMLEIYADLKIKNGYMDYDDLISKAGNLLQNSSSAEWIKYKLDGSIEHILIDEAQDTNHYQWNIIKAITEDFFVGETAAGQERSIFVVGDDKQSIYSFQGADPKIFSDIFSYYNSKLESFNSKLQNVQLQNSFRSYGAILKAVDLVFTKTRHHAIKTNYFGKVELWPIINIPQNKNKSADPFEWQMNFEPDEEYKSKELLAKIIAKTIKKWLEEKRLIINNGQPREIRCGDIMILVRKRTNNLGNLLIKYLQEEQIAVRGSDKINLEKHIITQDLLAAAKFVLLPIDDLNLACLLKSPICGLSEQELFDLCLIKNHQEISLFAAIKNSPKMAALYQKLQDLINKNNYHQYQLYQFFSYILDIKGARKAIVERFGKEAEEIINQFLILSLNYQQNNIAVLENFAQFLDNADLEVNIDLSSSELNEIRITTIHGSKGLEAPIIILADTAHNFQNQYGKDRNRIIWADEQYHNLPFWTAGKNIDLIKNIKKNNRHLENTEYLRSLYVAMTRAEEELYVTGFGEKESDDCWYSLIKKAIATEAKIKSFNFNEMLDENREYLIGEGLVMESSTSVIPATPFVIPAKAGIPCNMPEIPAFAGMTKEGVGMTKGWAGMASKAEEATEIIFPSKLTSEKLTSKFEFNQKLTYGKIVHKILEMLPGQDHTDQNARRIMIEKYLQQNIYIDDGEKEIILNQVFNILDKFHFLFGENSKAEVPVIGLIDGKLVSGKIDLLIIKDAEILIIDYKTGDYNSAYKQQLFLYKKLLQKIYPDKQIKCRVLLTQKAELVAID